MKIDKNRGNAMFNESDIVYKAEDIRYTVKGAKGYAIVLYPIETTLNQRKLFAYFYHTGS